MKVLIYISWPVRAWTIPDAHVERLRAQFPDVEFVREVTMEAAARAAVDADVAFTPRLTADIVRDAPRLRWVHSSAAAVEGLLPLAALAERDIVVTNARGVQAIPIAEHVIGGLLVLSRKFDRTLAAQREQRWIQNELCDDWPWMLHGRTMTIVGLGTIGLEVAKRASAFGMKVTGVRRNPDQPVPGFVERVVGPADVESALHGCDVLVLAAPGVASTQGMITADRLAMLNAGAVVVNVARAQIIEHGALLAALRSGRLGGAVLDVFEQEPLPPGDPLWSMPNVVVTPHVSGIRATHWDEVAEGFAENLRRFQRGDALENVVDREHGY